MLSNKIAVITGIYNSNSIAYGIFKQFIKEKAEVVCLVQNDKIKERVENLFDRSLSAEEKNQVKEIYPFDFEKNDTNTIKPLLNKLKSVDCLLHSVAFTTPASLKKEFHDITKEEYIKSHVISSYSLIQLSNMFYPLLSANSSLLCLSFIGSQYVIPEYGLMGSCKASLECCMRYLANDLGKNKGTKVNCVSACPINTVSLRGIPKFHDLSKTLDENMILKNKISIDDVGSLCCFLCSDLNKGITGQVINLDNGYSIIK